MNNPQKIRIIRNSNGQFVKGCNIAKLNIGIKKPAGFGFKISVARQGIKLSEETKQKMKLSKIGNKNGLGNKSHLGKIGSLSPNWIPDRTQLKKRDERNDSAYQNWVRQCKKRDKICKIKDENCDGYLVVHHIKPWRDFPELRYELLNGITLCQFHHPRKRIDEQRLLPTFIKLIGLNKY